MQQHLLVSTYATSFGKCFKALLTPGKCPFGMRALGKPAGWKPSPIPCFDIIRLKKLPFGDKTLHIIINVINGKKRGLLVPRMTLCSNGLNKVANCTNAIGNKGSMCQREVNDNDRLTKRVRISSPG